MSGRRIKQRVARWDRYYLHYKKVKNVRLGGRAMRADFKREWGFSD